MGADPGRPNIVVVVLDDVGFAQLGCYGASIETPSIDRIAAEGLRCTNFHTPGICSSTRASILTGRNHHAVGIGTVIDFSNGDPGYTGRLPRDARTLAEVLGDVGYATFCVGKWHLAAPGEQSPEGPFDTWPLGRGFDRYYGFLGGATSQWEPDLIEDERRVAPPRTPSEGYHLSADLVDRAIAMTDDARRASPEHPYFLWLAFGAGHDPHHVAREYVRHYEGRFDHGWDEERERVLARQVASGLLPPATELPPRNPGMPAWRDLDPVTQRVFCRLQEVFAGFMTHTDEQIGRLVDHLRSVGDLDRTLFMVVSDNGASAEGGTNGLLGIESPMSVVRLMTEAAAEGGLPHRVVAPMLFDDEGYPGYVAERAHDMVDHLDDMGGPGTHCHYPQGWAATGNTPFRRYKGNLHYGGVRDPLIVRMPGPAQDPGGLRNQFHHAVDLYPTILAVAGVPVTTATAGARRVDGVDMAGSLADSAAMSNRRSQYFAIYGHRGMYEDGWKAVTFHDRGSDYDADVWELYDTVADPTEARDLAAQHPEKVAALVGRWFEEADANQVLPLDDYPFLDIRFSPGPRSLYDYPEVRSISDRARPDLFTTSFRIAVDVRVGPESQGVLLANGAGGAGQVLYVRDHRLVFEWHGGGHRTEVAAPFEVRTAECTVEVHVDRLERTLALVVDGTTVTSEGGVTFPATPSVGTMDLGLDPDPHISSGYDGDFPFDGVITRVRIVTDDVAALDADGEQILRVALREQ